MKYLLLLSILILLWSVNDYYKQERRLAFSIKEGQESLRMYKSMISDCEEITRLKRKDINYNFVEEIHYDRDEFEKYNSKLNKLNYKVGFLTTHSGMYLDKYIIRKDFLSGELFFGGGDIRILAEFDEWYINSEKMTPNRDDAYQLLMAESYNIEYVKYSYDYCNKKIDTFNISRLIDIN